MATRTCGSCGRKVSPSHVEGDTLEVSIQSASASPKFNLIGVGEPIEVSLPHATIRITSDTPMLLPSDVVSSLLEKGLPVWIIS